MCSSFKLSKANWKIVFIVFVAVLFLKTILEVSLIIISSKSMKMDRAKMILINDQPQHERQHDEKGNFKILLWTTWYQMKWIDIVQKQPDCQFTNCEFSDDRTKLSSFDAILFHWYNTNPKDLPQQVYDHQKWVLFNMESPHYTARGFNHIGLKKVDWFMSYRTGSDIFTPYGQIVKCNTNWEQKYNFQNKTKSIAWFVSNCKTPSKRETYVKKLSQYIDVDIYGGCGPFKCRKYDDSCKDMIANTYKFYLSFENSICKDYVTEKAFHYMKYDIIPIVLGGANYSAIFAPNSYIDALNFTSPRDLAQYLQKIGSDESLYKSYFEWKNNYCVKRVDHNRNLCELCKRLNSDVTDNVQTMQNRGKWWSNSNCRSVRFKNETLQLVRA